AADAAPAAHPRAPDDIDRMAALIWRHAPAYLSGGRTATVTRWLEPFSPDEVAAHPPLALAAAWWSLTAGDTGRIAHPASLPEPSDREPLPAGTPARSAAPPLHALGGTQRVPGMRDDPPLTCA